MADWNAKIIEEFRDNGGVVGGVFAGKPILLLHHTGAKTGKRRVNPLMYQKLDGGYAIFASKAGASSHPDWYHNVLANPDVDIEVGTQRLELKARKADTAEREPIWTKQKDDFPQFADYEASTDRTIPVIILEPR
jgi:deazaflavin-dependent oxidoreductase (nitroreductase family)